MNGADVDAVVQRVTERLGDEARRNVFVNPDISTADLGRALRGAPSTTWIARDERRIVGHLHGAVLESAGLASGAWVGPDGVSFDDAEILSALYASAGQAWIDAGAREHYAWVLDDAASTAPWYDLGFARVHSRGALALGPVRVRSLPNGYQHRRGTIGDLDVAEFLAREIDHANALGPSFVVNEGAESAREDLAEILSEPDTALHFVEYDGQPIAQCIAFPLPAQRGSFRATIHLSAVVVRRAHQGQGIARAMVDTALNEARARGFAYGDTSWRVTNRGAHRFWTRYGFGPTYVRLHRTIGPN